MQKKTSKHKTPFCMYFRKHYTLYMLMTIPIIYYIIFKYVPMIGILSAFENYKIKKGIWESEWVGLKIFNQILSSSKFWRAFWNTIKLNFLGLLFGFPAPIILAMFLNELRVGVFKKITQTILYLPHFLSAVMMGGIFVQVFATDGGIINSFLSSCGLAKIPFLTDESTWVRTYIGTEIWQGIGWGAIIYLSAISGIDLEQYESAKIDGCNRFNTMFRITLPNILPTIMIMFILKVGSMVSIGLEMPLMLGNANVRGVSEVLSTYTYVVGMEQGKYNVATAIGLFQSVVNLALVFGANKLSGKTTGESLW